MKVAICIDYDNLLDVHKSTGMLDIVTKTLMKLPATQADTGGECEIRLYGGWYEGNVMTQRAQNISVEIQRDFPALVRLEAHSDRPLVMRLTAELAVALLEEPSHHLLSTFRKKGQPQNVRVESPQNVGCKNTMCALPTARQLLSSGKCPIAGCVTLNQQLIYRHEQKMVDTMLTCDLFNLAKKQYDHLLLISDDDDFLPPIRTLVLQGAKITRVRQKSNMLIAPIVVAGTQVVQMEIA